MQKKFISACIAMAVSNGYAGAAENITTPVQPAQSKIVCPQDMKTLSAEQKKQLPAECLKAEDSNLAWLVAGGFAAAVAMGIGVTEHNDNGGHHSDNGGGGDGGDVTKTFANGVTLDESAHTLTFASMTLNGQRYSDVVFTYTQQGENALITLPDGKSATVTGWETDSNNNLLLKGTYGPDNLFWGFNSKGQVVLASANTNVIDGDGKSNQVDGDSTASGSGETGTIINGNDTSNTISGDTTAADGGTGTVISGDDTTNTISGDTNASGGGTGTVISGDDTTNTISGDTNASGGGTGTVISGDDTDNTISGDTSASDGGTGTQINGDNAVVDNQGNTTADGEGSTGTEINGDNANVTQSGDILATNGATGLSVSGKSATLTNKGTVTAKDAGSVGISISGDNASFTNTGTITASNEATGVSISGNHGSTTLDGDVSLAIEQDAAGTVHGETGVAISGNQNSVDITGDVTISTPTPLGLVSAETDADITGVSVTGTGNTLTLDGSLTLDEQRTVDDDRGTVEVTGLDVEGDNNTVYLKGGVNIDATNDAMSQWHYFDNSKTGIKISGESEVIVSDNSSLSLSPATDNTSSAPSTAVFAKVSDGGALLFDDTSVLDISMDVGNTSGMFYTVDPGEFVIQTTGVGTVAENDGQINISSASVSILSATEGATLVNRGEIQDSDGTDDKVLLDNSFLYATGSGSQAINSGVLTSVAVSHDVVWGLDVAGVYTPLGAGGGRHYLIMGMDGASVDNTAEGTISATGLGFYGVAVSNSGTTGTNEGTINLNSYVPTVDENDTVTGMSYNADYNRNTSWENGAGMLATDSATATNTGTINVTDSGIGMLAYGGKVVNQGTINLTTDGYSTGEGGLVGMSVMAGGVAINDESGIININNATYGKAFYNDGSGEILNYGRVCIDADCQDAATYNPTDSAISVEYKDGLLSEAGETVVLVNNAWIDGEVSNQGTVSGSTIAVEENGLLTNDATGNISNVVRVDDGGEVLNAGTISGAVTVYGEAKNSGTISGAVNVNTGGTLHNTGTVSSSSQTVSDNGGTIINEASGTIHTGLRVYDSAQIINHGQWYADNGKDFWLQAGSFTNETDGTMILTGGKNYQGDAGTHLDNKGTITSDGSQGGRTGLTLGSGGGSLITNSGTITQTGGSSSLIGTASDVADDKVDSLFWNQSTGMVTYNGTNHAVQVTNKNTAAQNDGTITVDGNNAVAMDVGNNAQAVNNGTINVGTEGTSNTGMIGMQLDSTATADAVIENNGTINIYASNSYAFSKLGANGKVVNNGVVNIDDSVTGSALIKQSGTTIEGSGDSDGDGVADGEEVHYADITLPSDNSTPATPASNDLNGYVVGTNADGSAGKLMVSNASMNGVGINTGFTAGTAATTVTFDNVVEGSNLTDASAITSTSVVWTATGTKDQDGNVDVTMSKNAYADVTTDGNVSSVAQALDAGYTNNALYNSLNVSSTAELNNALEQISGSQATSIAREARVLSNRFDMLADAAPVVNGSSLAFNVVAKGDPRAELGNKAQYDMLALRQTLNLSAGQTLGLEYGIARLDGSGSQTAGDNGVTGGYSQFFGLKHTLALSDDGLAWSNGLRYDIHNLSGSRSVSYGDVGEVADADNNEQYLEYRTEGSKTWTLDSGLTVKPYAGMKLRHTTDGGYQEHGGGDFNLKMSSSTETAVDSIVGLKLDYAGKNGWSANAMLEGGPNVSYAKSARTASLQGAAGQDFNVDDGQQGGGVNSSAVVGVKYSAGDTQFAANAYQWKEDTVSDKGFMLNLKRSF